MKLFLKLLSYIDKKSFIYYVIVGVTSAALNFFGFVVFFRWAHLHYLVANSLSYFISTTFNFIANRNITFSGRGNAWHLHLMKYLCIAFLNYLVSLVTVHLVVTDLHLTPYFGVVIAIGMMVMSGYLFSKHWIYRAEVSRRAC
ncbi:MAG: hypothetical protein A3F13_09420 [Gammaproteobacteria bacterium RIFCSPHIGHO2_12_FULL_40_19]|nr:MAG: hypothetical protein A3F13_09420 [Gammaproteobacteria bacterium RIFCSPHIGHO2_12_FULL_40_19]